MMFGHLYNHIILQFNDDEIDAVDSDKNASNKEDKYSGRC